jgi:hypothetical protein
MMDDSFPAPAPEDVIEAALGGDRPDLPDGYAANALVLGASGQRGERHVCGELLSVFDSVNLLGVAIQHDPTYYRRVWSDHFEGSPARLGIVDVGGREEYDSDTVRTVSSASDLTGIGITVTDAIKNWSDTPEPTVVCLDSLTPLLQYSELERVYRFLDVTTSRLNQVCAVSHAHVNPLAHDEQTLQQLMGVFDAVVDPGEDAEAPAEWSVRPA